MSLPILNLALLEAAKCSPKAVSLFRIIQRIFRIFAVSLNRWQILRENLHYLNSELLPDTSLEC
jgi:hypothetical protein